MSESRVVADSGPLIALASIDHFEILEELYTRIIAPDAVIREVAAQGRGRPGAEELNDAKWIERVTVSSAPDPLLAKELGDGEAEVITLAREVSDTLVLLDDRRARRIAVQAYGLNVKGSAGVLVSAKKVGLIDSVRELLTQMRRKGYFISDRLLEGACRAAGE